MKATNLNEIEINVSSMRYMQDEIQKSSIIMRDAMTKTWTAMKELNAKLNAATCGAVPIEKLDDISVSDWSKYMTDEGFVTELASISDKSSPTIRLAGYLRAVKGICKCRKSIVSKIDKLEDRIDYLIKHKSFGTDYGQSRELHQKVNETLSIVDRRLMVIMKRYFDERLGILKIIQTTTSNICSEVVDKEALRTAALYADDRYVMDDIMFKMNNVRK